MAPENPQDSSDKEAKALKRVAIDNVTWADLSIADPESEGVTKFMTDHGLQFGDNVVLDVEGLEQPVVVTTDRHDFFTRDRALSEALAQGLISVETEAVSPELLVDPETKIELADTDFTLISLQESNPSEDESVGEATSEPDAGEAVNETDEETETAKDPEREKQEVLNKLQNAKFEYTRQVSMVMDEFNQLYGEVNKITIELGDIQRALDRTLILLKDDVVGPISETVEKSRNGTYGNATAQKSMSDIANKLPAMKSRFESAASVVAEFPGKKTDFVERLEAVSLLLDRKQADFEAEIERIRREQPGGKLPDDIDVRGDVSDVKQHIRAIKDQLGPYLDDPAAMHDDLIRAGSIIKSAMTQLDSIAAGGEVASGEALRTATELKEIVEFKVVVPDNLLKDAAKDAIEKEWRQTHGGAE